VSTLFAAGGGRLAFGGRGGKMAGMKRSDIPAAEIIAACNAFHAGTAPTPDVALADKYPPKVVLAKMEQLIDRGVLECGVSTRTAWAVESAAR
jgi:hypothetical protein